MSGGGRQMSGTPERRPSLEGEVEEEPLVTFRDLTVSYGPVPALAGVSGAFRPGPTGLLGPNGAGKTTLLKALSGSVPATAGRIDYQGRDVGRLSAAGRARLGIAHVPEGRKVFPSLTVLENLEVGSYRSEAKRCRAESSLQVSRGCGMSIPTITTFRKP